VAIVTVNEKRISQLNEEFQEITKQLVLSQRQTSAYIRRHAEILEEKFILLGQSDKINTISTILTEHYRANGLHAAEWLHDFLDIKYKDPKKMTNLKLEAGRFTSDLLVDYSIEDLQNMERNKLQQLENQAYDCRDYFIGIADMFEKKNKQLRNVCLLRQIATIPKDVDHPFDAMDSKKHKVKDARVSTECDTEPSITRFSELVKEISERLQFWSEEVKKTADKIVQFKPSIEEDIEVYCEAAEGFLAMINSMIEYNRPFKDEKFSFDFLDWFAIQITQKWHGKNAAAGARDVKLPGSKHVDGRGLTREQVGDRIVPTYKVMVKLIQDVLLPMGLYMQELPQWRKKYVNDHIRDRKMDLTPTLVDRKS